MGRRQRRKFTDGEKAEAVRLAREVGSIGRGAKDLDLTESALRAWVKQADTDEGQGPEGALTTDELKELRQLRRENRTLRMERDFLKKPQPSSPRKAIRVRVDRSGEGQLSHHAHVPSYRRFPKRSASLASAALHELAGGC